MGIPSRVQVRWEDSGQVTLQRLGPGWLGLCGIPGEVRGLPARLSLPSSFWWAQIRDSLSMCPWASPFSILGSSFPAEKAGANKLDVLSAQPLQLLLDDPLSLPGAEHTFSTPSPPSQCERTGQDFPGGLVVETLCFHCRRGKKKKKREKERESTGPQGRLVLFCLLRGEFEEGA